MATSFKFYHDSALTTEVDASNPIEIAAVHPGGTYTDVQLWLGSVDADVQVQADSDPGVDDIEIAIVDADGGGTGNADTACKLATSQVGLAAAVAGDPLAIGPTLASGVANAYPFWLRVSNAATVVGVYTDLSLETNDLIESPAP